MWWLCTQVFLLQLEDHVIWKYCNLLHLLVGGLHGKVCLLRPNFSPHSLFFYSYDNPNKRRWDANEQASLSPLQLEVLLKKETLFEEIGISRVHKRTLEVTLGNSPQWKLNVCACAFSCQTIKKNKAKQLKGRDEIFPLDVAERKQWLLVKEQLQYLFKAADSFSVIPIMRNVAE